MLSEHDITAQIRGLLKVFKVFHYKHWQGPMSGNNGTSDIIGIYNGKFLAIEIKKEGWKPPSITAKTYKHYQQQKDFIDNVNAQGGIGFFAASLEDVIRELGLSEKNYWRG